MATTQIRRLGILAGLVLLMAMTRVHHSFITHFDALPDASWGIFFLAGFWLRGSGRWAFALLMAEAVLIDYFVISGQGIDFWSHYCVSAAYWFLVPSYGALWLGGSWLAKQQNGLTLRTLGLAVAALLISENLCYLISNGSFYWLSASVPQPRTMAAWTANLGDWYAPFLTTTALYVAVGGALHAMALQLQRLAGRGASADAGR